MLPLAAAAAAMLAPAAQVPAAPVQLLAPVSGTAPVNAATIHVEAIVRAPVARVFLDHRLVRTLRTACAVQDAVVSLPTAGLADGPHLVVVAAGDRRAGAVVTLSSTAARRQESAVEAAATPAPFACLSHSRLTLQPGRTIDAQDKLVLQRGAATRVVTAAGLGLRRIGGGTYALRIPRGPFSLRIGSNWGAVRADDDRVAWGRAPVDSAHVGVATIGPDGGRVVLTTGAGVHVTLDVPAGALAEPTPITVSATAQPLLPDAADLQPGLRFEPDGLVFAKPALLTLDFAGTGKQVRAGDAVFLATSPLTALPLIGTADVAADTLTGRLPHFSETSAGLTAQQLTDLKAWADPVLQAHSAPTLTDVEEALQLAALQQLTGCDPGDCIDLDLLRVKTDVAVQVLSTNACAPDVEHPSPEAVQRWLNLATATQELGGDSDPAVSCANDVLTALIVDASPAGIPLDADTAPPLLQAAATAGARFPALRKLALQKLASAARLAMAAAQSRCADQNEVARAALTAARSLSASAAEVDPNLDLDFQRALDGCSPPPPPPPAPPPPPPPVSADGCAADVAAPTLAKLDHWIAVEEAATPGADTTAVVACEFRLLEVLLAAQTTSATANHTDADFQALVDLQSRATTVNDPAAHPLTALDTVLTNRLQTAQSSCATDTAAARADIEQVVIWAPAAAPVDAALGTNAQAALATCTVVTLDALALGGGSADGSCLGSWIDYGDFATGQQELLCLPADGPLPVTFAQTFLGHHQDFSISRVDGATIRIDGSSDPQQLRDPPGNAVDGRGGMLIALQLTPTVSGHLLLDVDNGWASLTNPPWLLPDDPWNQVAVIYSPSGVRAGPNGGGVPVGPDVVQTSAGPSAAATLDQLDQTFAVTAGQTVTLEIMTSIITAGSGRLATIALGP